MLGCFARRVFFLLIPDLDLVTIGCIFCDETRLIGRGTTVEGGGEGKGGDGMRVAEDLLEENEGELETRVLC